MAIEWGAWEYSGGNGMRVGIEVTASAVSHTSDSVKFTVKVYTDNQYSYNDGQTLSYGGAIGGSTSYTNNDGSTAQLRATKTYTYTYGANEYGSSPGNRTFSATVSGAYNGVTPSKSVTKAIPARPIAAPATPSGAALERLSDSTLRATWSNNSTSGEPYESMELQKWNQIGGDWASQNLGVVTTHDTSALAYRRYRVRVRAKNSAGTSGWAYSNYEQTTPASPTNATVTKASTTSVTISWSNTIVEDYDYTLELEQSVDGGVWTLIDTLPGGTTSVSRTGLTPGAVYQFRVRNKSTVGDTTYSGYSTTGTIQLQAPPAAPTIGSVVRNSDTSMTLDWTNNATVDAPYDSITVQRWDNVDNIWTTVASIPGSSVNVTDTSTVANRKYRYQIRANNSAGSSAWVQYDYIYTTPDAPSQVEAEYTGGTAITVSWVTNASYLERTVTVTPYKNGVAETPVQLAGGETFYEHMNVDVLATYYFKVKTVSTVGSLSSAETQSNDVQGATPPNAPSNLAPTGIVTDLNNDTTFTWLHSKSVDRSKQRQYEVQHRVSGGVWASSGIITSATPEFVLPAGTYANPNGIEWQVRTWGIHPDPGPWSATATLTGSTTPTLTLNTPGATIITSAIDVDWDYFDQEATAQAGWEVRLFDATGTYLIEEVDGADTTSALTLSTSAVDGESYLLSIRVRDGSGLWSEDYNHSFVADFVPPAEVLLDASMDSSSGAMILSLTPTPDDGGLTTLPATSVTIERQIWDDEIEDYGDWEVLAEDVDPSATLIDTTAPVHDDGQYRVTTYSAAPSSYRTPSPIKPPTYERKWLYVSGGPQFDVVCRMWANIELGVKVSRSKGLHYFAGRKKPVLYTGESTERVITVSGLITDDASGVGQWQRLAKQPGPVLLRAPAKPGRIFGAMSEVSIERVGVKLHKVSFSIQETWR